MSLPSIMVIFPGAYSRIATGTLLDEDEPVPNFPLPPLPQHLGAPSWKVAQANVFPTVTCDA